ncbi:MAG: hypothetical protein VZR24_14355 [Butyrivibrio hungatei]|nr:hypothetical protein [Butyrivibrio hungatei]
MSMLVSDKMFKKIIAPYVDDASAKTNTRYSYPAIVVDNGIEYFVSTLKYDSRSGFGVPFTFHFEYNGNIIHGMNCFRIVIISIVT